MTPATHFSPEDIAVMVLALDKAMQKLRNRDTTYAANVRECLARTITQVARPGDQDADRLCDRVLELCRVVCD